MFYNIRALGLACVHALAFSATASAQSFPWATPIPRTGWTVTADSFQVGNEPEKVLDSNSSTIWHTRYTPEIAPLPHYIQLDSRFLFFMQSLSSYKVSGHSGVCSLK